MAPRLKSWTVWTSILLGGILLANTLAALLPKLWDNIYGLSTDINVPRFNATGQSTTCIGLAETLPKSVYSKEHGAFGHFLKTYWSAVAAEEHPSCVVQPANADEVATTIKYLRNAFDRGEDARFAVRSGGHSPEAGFSSVENGLVIDMSLINQVTVSDDRSTAVIGVGARWADVYSKLDLLGLAVVGGRNANVGVGGLVLGGGISFFSPRYGMVCDNIDKYEVVLANGSIVEASAHQHTDLWRSLKGGTGNYGIVTRITTHTFSSGKLWAGYAYWTNWQVDRIFKAFHDFNLVENFDKHASGPILAFVYVRDVGLRMVAGSLAYSKPEKWPAVYRGFKSIPRVWSTTKIRSLTMAAEELNGLSPPGRRQYQVTTTIKNDLETFQAFNNIYSEQLGRLKQVKGSHWALVFQPLSSAVTRKGSPNVLGLETRAANDTLVIVLLCATWSRAEDDNLVYTVSRDIIAQGEQYAQEHGHADPYIYLNYAASGQDVTKGYGSASKAFMHETSKAYDPDGFFQVARAGGFKLDLSDL